MNKVFLFDNRWCGETGIGRFASEIGNSEIDFENINLSGNPAGKYDVFRLTLLLAGNKRFYFSPGYNAPLLFLNRCVITVHDLNHVDLDFNSSILKRIYYRFVLKRACRNTAKVITVSEFSKRRIVDWAGVPPEKVIVVGNGVSKEFNLKAEKHAPGFPYIFVVGNRKEHKNEARALKAFLTANLSEDTKIIFSGTKSESLSKIIEEHDASSRVVFSGRLSNSELASLYRGAECLLFPSLYEGFGIPVIEAMACGTPVVTSNSTSLIEVAGDAACLVNPESVESITSGINKVCNDNNYRDNLIKLGLEQSKKYSWKNTISEVKLALNRI